MGTKSPLNVEADFHEAGSGVRTLCKIIVSTDDVYMLFGDFNFYIQIDWYYYGKQAILNRDNGSRGSCFFYCIYAVRYQSQCFESRE